MRVKTENYKKTWKIGNFGNFIFTPSAVSWRYSYYELSTNLQEIFMNKVTVREMIHSDFLPGKTSEKN